MRGAFFFGLLLVTSAASAGTESERLYLSGTGFGDTVDWELRVGSGRGSGAWTRIAVPSQWELEGFGSYSYGRDDDRPHEVGHYRHRFRLPERFRGRHLELVFEGVMTDARVRLNGQPAGAVHQGGFTRFSYDVTALARFGDPNLLEVEVAERSADASVNRAERDADYWLFGGIYRPVYLEISPPEHLAHLAIDARHDGSLSVRVRRRGPGDADRLEAQVYTLEGEPVGRAISASLGLDTDETVLSARLADIRPWSAETPHLYRLEARLFGGGELLHRRSERFGFRSFEVRTGEGLFVNGRRILLKGVNRHSFWPESGRTLDRELNRRDAELIRAMSLNAVRTAHYPPDVDFLDACDELGLYVVAELPGWHDAYDTEVGRRLVEEMVARDVNHPSILFWANGNEGGWNTALDGDFARHDPQGRPVLHPQAVFSGLDTVHYPTWEELRWRLDPRSWRHRLRGLRRAAPPLVMPTEMLHGLFDGGGGAGLEAFWRAIRASPLGAGGFLWALFDEGVVRTDRGGEIDVHGAYAPDGLLGPFRQKEGSFYAVRELLSPVVLGEAREEGGHVEVAVENRFDMTDLAACRFRWSWLRLPGPREAGGEVEVVFAEEAPGPALAPGARGRLRARRPPEVEADALRLVAIDPHGREVASRTTLLRRPRWRERPAGLAGDRASARDDGVAVVLSAGGLEARFDRATGELRELRRDGRAFPLGPGPRPAAGGKARLLSARRLEKGEAQLFQVRYAAGLGHATWRLDASGWLHLSYQYPSTGGAGPAGIRFELEESEELEVAWLGEGPAPVWANRLAGGELGLWRNRFGGERSYPESRGFFGGVLWARLERPEGRLSVVLESPGLFLGLFSPRFPTADPGGETLGHTTAPTSSGLAFLNEISAIGSKFHPAEALSPAGRPHPPSLHRGSVAFYLDPPR